MNDNLIYPIAIHTKPTKLEQFLSLLLIAFIFIPFSYGIFTKQGLYCLSLPLGFLGILTFNYFTDDKFTTLKIIQKNKFISFSENEVKILENEEYILYDWNELENIEIKLIAYKNKWRDENDIDDGRYDGIENYLLFTFKGVIYKYLFYVETLKKFNLLSDYLEKIILPKLYQSKSIKNESIIISKLDYTELQKFKGKYNINRYTDFIHFN
ncbi:MAG: hypothetical protein K2X95_13120 [Flavobacteriaceae bacterium]|nr:hypothetical protein [Flavobacteriaceae bacterium]